MTEEITKINRNDSIQDNDGNGNAEHDHLSNETCNICLQTFPISIRIESEDLEDWKRFRQYIFSKHGTFYGKLRRELMDAIRLYLSFKDNEQHGAMSSKISRIKSREESRLRQIRKALHEWSVRNKEDVISESKLIELIRTTIAARDQRTVEKYLTNLVELGVKVKMNQFMQERFYSIHDFISPTESTYVVREVTRPDGSSTYVINRADLS